MSLTSIANKLARLQVARPWAFILSTLLLTAIAGALAAGLKFDSSYEALLPRDSAELANADDVRNRTGGSRQIVVAITGDDKDARVAFGRALVPRLRELSGVRTVDLEFPVGFFKDRGLWLMSVSGLDALVPALKEAVRVAKWQANPMALHLDEEAEKKELEEAWQKVDAVVETEREELPFDEVLMSKDEKYTFVLLIPSIKFTNMAVSRQLLAEIHETIEETDPAAYGVTVRTAGQLDLLQEQHQTMGKDLRNASLLALILGTLIVASFTRRLTAPLLIGAALIAGVTWTFALTRLLIGHVNIITGFLVAVLIGLGIDFGVHLFVRYQQERDRGADSINEAIVRSVTGTLQPALTSALTTAGTFFSFVIADFRGFSEFGLIAGIGVLLTLASSFVILPSLLALVDRNKKAADPSAAVPLVRKPLNRAVSWGTAITVLLIAAYGALHLTEIPFRNNFRELRGHSEATTFLDYVDENLGVGFNPTVILTKNLADARRAQTIVEKQKQRGRKDGTPSRIGRVFSIVDVLPSDIDSHRSRVAELRAILDDPKLDRAEKKEGKRAEQLASARRMVHTEPWTAEQLPETFLRRLTTLDRKEFVLFVWPAERNDSDFQAVAWEDETQEIATALDAEGIVHSMADETLILAWIYHLITADGPRLLGVALVVVIAFLLLDFRSPWRAGFVFFPLCVGMLLFAAVMYLTGVELNMYNLIVIPSVIGIGIDNAVHIFHRYRTEGRGSILHVVRATGAAAMTASVTTAVGFGASLISHSVGLQSMGSTAMAGIGATFVAAVVFFPCLLGITEGLRRDRATIQAHSKHT